MVLGFLEGQVALPGLAAGALWDRLAVLEGAGKHKEQRQGLHMQIFWVPGGTETRAILLYLLCVMAFYTLSRRDTPELNPSLSRKCKQTREALCLTLKSKNVQ